MRPTPLRLALSLATLLVALPLARLSAADTPPAAPEATAPTPATTPAEGVTPAAAPAPAVTAAPAPVPAPAVADQDTADAKLAVVLRSYTLMQEENDQLKAAQQKSADEKASLEAQLEVAKRAIPVAAQANALREQLRQTQDQLAALSLENNDLKTRLATGPVSSVPGRLTPSNVPTTLAPAVMPTPAPAAPEVRYHVVVAGETLGKIAHQYYGTSSRWPEILAANKDVLKNEKSLYVGAKLRIP